MYEVTVSVINEQKYLLDSICQDMFYYIQRVDGTCANLQQKHRSYFCVAFSDTYKHQAKRLLSQCVSKVLALGYKNIFVRNLLEVDQGNFHQNVLINTVCAFDQQFDTNTVANIIDCNQDVYLDGYYNFRMRDIKRKWENVVNMILENNFILSDNELIVEFLQYLLQSIEAKADSLSICFDDLGYTLYNSEGKIVNKLATLSKTATSEEEAIVNAICQNVKKLKVYYCKSPSKEFCDVAKTLFDVQYLQVQ